MTKKQRYKHTEIGTIPTDWKIEKLGEVADIVGGGTPSTSNAEFWSGDVNWFTPTEIGKEKYVFSSERKITSFGLQKSSAKLLPVGTILLTSRATIGDVSILVENKASTNQGFQSLIAKKNTHNEFLYYKLLTIKDEIISLASGSTFLEISPNKLKSIKIALPSLPEQSRIASVLSDTDTLITALDKLIEKKKKIKDGAMVTLLTPKKKNEWKEVKLGEVGTTFGGLTGKIKSDFGNGHSQYITFLNVLNNPIINKNIFEKVNVKQGESQNLVRKGDLFFNTSSETPEDVGTCSVLLDDVKNVYLNSFCFGYRTMSKKVDGLFLSYFFRSKKGREIMTALAQGATRYNLSKSLFNSIILKVPNYKKQTEIANILSSMDVEISALEQKREKYRQIKSGMMQQLLNGQIRLN